MAFIFQMVRGVEVEISYYPVPDIKKGHYFSFLNVYKEDQENMTKIDVFKEIKLFNGFYCCVGEGSYGSEGFVAYLDERKNLLWVLYSETSNPFINIMEECEGIVVAESSANFKIRLDVNKPTSLSLK